MLSYIYLMNLLARFMLIPYENIGSEGASRTKENSSVDVWLGSEGIWKGYVWTCHWISWRCPHNHSQAHLVWRWGWWSPILFMNWIFSFTFHKLIQRCCSCHQIQIWLAMAYEANNRHTDCIDLYQQLEKKHPSVSIRRQAAELRYILQAPKLKISQEEMVTIPLIGSSYDR